MRARRAGCGVGMRVRARQVQPRRRDRSRRVLPGFSRAHVRISVGGGGGQAGGAPRRRACHWWCGTRACGPSRCSTAGTEAFNPGARRVANNVARVERDLTGGLLGSLENIHKLNAGRWCAAETALVNYVIDSVSGSGRLLLAWLADSLSCHANGDRDVPVGVLRGVEQGRREAGGELG